jgi:hypothetical protein
MAGLTAAQRRALEASNFPLEQVNTTLRKHTRRVAQCRGDAVMAVLADNMWKSADEGPPSSFSATGGRERIFCASIVYFELTDAGRDPATDPDLRKVCAKLGELIRCWTYYQFPIAKQPEVARHFSENL